MLVIGFWFKYNGVLVRTVSAENNKMYKCVDGKGKEYLIPEEELEPVYQE